MLAMAHRMRGSTGGAAAARRVSPGALLSLAVLATVATSLSSLSCSLRAAAQGFSAAAWVASPASAAAASPRRGEAVVMRAKKLDTAPKKDGRSPFYSTLDRDRLARRRQEIRDENRERRRAGPTSATLNYEMLPSVEDIYARAFSGNSTNDPIGGRKRYTLHLMFKHDPSAQGPESLKKAVLEYIWFFKNRMSCRSVEAKTVLSPLDGRSKVTTLEYPMKEYGELPKGQKSKAIYQKAIMVEFEFYAPPDAIEYIRARIYKDNMILRHMFLGHTKNFKNLGEDNELHL